MRNDSLDSFDSVRIDQEDDQNVANATLRDDDQNLNQKTNQIDLASKTNNRVNQISSIQRVNDSDLMNRLLQEENVNNLTIEKEIQFYLKNVNSLILIESRSRARHDY